MIKQSLDKYLSAIRFNPHYGDAYANLGSAYYDLGKINSAIKAINQALKLDPDHANANYNLAQCYRDKGKWMDVAHLCNKVIERNPYHLLAHGTLVESYLRTGLWNDYQEVCKTTLSKYQSSEEVKKINPPLHPFSSLYIPSDLSWQKLVAEQWAQHLKNRAGATPYKHNKARSDEPALRIGYISPDFCDHPVGLIIRDIFKHHNRKRFEIYGYDIKGNKGPQHDLIARSFDELYDVSDLSNAEIAKKIYNDRIHILVDLSGYTRGNRCEILAYQPAPIQCQMLGYPCTSGADYYQYYITQERMVPKNLRLFFDETLMHLPDTSIAAPGFFFSGRNISRKMFGLPEKDIVFCCFHQSYRIEPNVFNAWMQILEKVPKSVLWLMSDNQDYIQQIHMQAEKKGIKRERIIFADPEPMSKRWIHQLADMWLDTFSLSAGTSSILCIYSGLPIVTLQGDKPQSRTAAGFLGAAGLNELITESVSEYIQRVVHLTQDQNTLHFLRNRLLNVRQFSPLFNPIRYIHNLELCYKKMWANLCEKHS